MNVSEVARQVLAGAGVEMLVVDALQPDTQIGGADRGEEFDMLGLGEGGVDLCPEQGFGQKAIAGMGLGQIAKTLCVQVQTGVKQENRGRAQGERAARA